MSVALSEAISPRERAEIERLLATIGERFPEADLDVVRRAHTRAAEAHAGQRRASGEPYIHHPIAVAQVLADLGLDANAVAAALLHDVVEDTAIEGETVEAEFGPEIARLVAGVTKISAIEAREKSAQEAESLRRMLLAATDDLRVILIKLADRLHNMRTLGALSPERRERMARETLEIYAPLANRLGIWQVKSQFEDLVLKELEPETFAAIRDELRDRRHQHRSYLKQAIADLDAALREAGIEAKITSRAKHYYSIYRKMERKDVGADEIYDVLGIRVLVEDVPQCYLALGVVHTLWQPVKGEFDDYIAKKKPNLYQSLHTTVYGPDNRPFEVQIRTHEMHEVAEYGVAAHWLYKENQDRADEVKEKVAALRRLLHSHNEDATDAEAFVEGLKTDVFRDQVYVFTPQGDVIELPTGATPVDFAYYIHTEVGHRCRGALVNGEMVALDTPLQTGETVKVLTVKGEAGPSRDWLNPALGYVASNRARSKIKQWFRRQAKAEAVRDGREVIDRQLRKLGLTRVSHDEVAALFDYERLDEFLAAVGRHEVPSENISARLLEAEQEQEVAPRPKRAAAPTETPPQPDVGPVQGVTMRGADGVYTRVAGCCRPLPGEKVIGYVTRGKGVTLHRRDCHNIARLRAHEPERFIRVNWQQTDQQAYPVELRVLAYDRSGLVRDISDLINRREVGLTAISATANSADSTALVSASVHVQSHDQLTGLIDKLETIDNVIEVRRPTS